MEDRLDWLRLLRSRRVGVTTFHRLLAEHGSAAAALSALPGIARGAGVRDYATASRDAVEAEYAAGERAGARLVALADDDYPEALADLADAPPLLWALGDMALVARPAVAVVGARNASSLGMRMARKLAGDLAEDGITVASGLARGVDTAAHKGALDRGGATVAVMAGGVDVVYPPENAALHREIAERGLVLSEQPMHMTPQARNFPMRNRIVSGLSRAVVVIEAAAKSGSLITARAALDQGREVLAVPGHPFDARASGCNMLIRDGARLVRGAADVAEAIAQGGAYRGRDAEVVPLRPRLVPVAPVRGGHPVADDPAAPVTPAAAPSPDEPLGLRILDRLGPSPVAEDQLIRDLGRPTADVTAALVELELDGLIQRQPGGLVARVD